LCILCAPRLWCFPFMASHLQLINTLHFSFHSESAHLAFCFSVKRSVRCFVLLFCLHHQARFLHFSQQGMTFFIYPIVLCLSPASPTVILTSIHLLFE
jgi:hypothetical protein